MKTKMTKSMFFLFFMVATFSMKRKSTATNFQKRDPNTSANTALLGKNTWSIVHTNFLPKTEKKFNEMQKSFRTFSTKYKNVSSEVYGPSGVTKNDMNWRFFEHLETQDLVVDNVTDKDRNGTTVLHVAIVWDNFEIAQFVVDAGVDMNAQEITHDMTAIHMAAYLDRLAIGRMLIESGADLEILYKRKTARLTALQIATRENHVEFAEMLRKKLGIN